MAIYFIQCGTNGPIKIGQTSNDVQERISQLQTGCPYELKLIWVYSGSDWDEKSVHKELIKEHIRGEWFHPSDSVYDFIKSELFNTYEHKTQNRSYTYCSETFGGVTNIYHSGNGFYTDMYIKNGELFNIDSGRKG